MPDPALQAEVDAKLAADPEMSNFGCEHNTTTTTNHLSLPASSGPLALALTMALTLRRLTDFFTQHHDYVTIKRGVVEEVLAGRKGSPEGVATIAMGVETLRLAEYLKETIEAQLRADSV